MALPPDQQPALESLPHEPPSGPSVMAKAHADGLRKASAKLKPYLANRDDAEAALRVAVLMYLAEWGMMYAVGAREAAMPTDRVIIQIRQDTVQQMVAELGKGD